MTGENAHEYGPSRRSEKVRRRRRQNPLRCYREASRYRDEGYDSQLVACSSKDELDRVRESWCKKKLALTQADADLDKAIAAICDKMKADKNKSRVAFYYLLAAHFDKLAVLK
jgi:Protein of unknown function (DUF2853)